MRTEWSTGAPSFSLKLVWKKSSSVCRWQSPLAEIAASRDGSAGTENRAGDAAGRPERDAEVLAREVFHDAFGGGKEEQLVLDDGPADGAAELVAAEARERRAVRGCGGQRFGAEIFEGAGVNVIGAGLGDDVDHAAGGAAEFGVGAAGDDLELLYGFQA